ELHPYFNQEALVQYNTSKGIVTQAWRPLGRASSVIDDENLVEIATKHNKIIPQVILKWHIQNGVVPIPKSTTVSRQLQNMDIFDFYLDSNDIEKINALIRTDGRRKGQDPATYEEF